jgi:hypothetical protein
MARRRAIGIIAEDKSDIAVLECLIGKLAAAPFSIKHFVGNGCGRIAGKCQSWAQNLFESGCQHLLVVHDSDDKNPRQLRLDLTNSLQPSPIASFAIVIPIREIEAWLLADHTAIARALNLRGKSKAVANPEALHDPKKHLAELVLRWSKNKRRYVNAIDNPKIARECSVDSLGQCGSFLVLRDFILEHFS